MIVSNEDTWETAWLDGDSLACPKLTLDVGITGHRLVRLDPALTLALPTAIDGVLRALRDGSLRLTDDDAPALWLHSALATGADQFAASSAQALGYKVRAILPFAREAYREDFIAGDERAEFDRQFAAAQTTLALPCPRDGSDAGYVMVGKTIVAACDILVAVWDGDSTENAEG